MPERASLSAPAYSPLHPQFSYQGLQPPLASSCYSFLLVTHFLPFFISLTLTHPSGLRLEPPPPGSPPGFPQLVEMLPPSSHGALPHPTTSPRSPHQNPICLPNDPPTVLFRREQEPQTQSPDVASEYARSHSHQDSAIGSQADDIQRVTFNFSPTTPPRLWATMNLYLKPILSSSSDQCTCIALLWVGINYSFINSLQALKIQQ